MVMTGHLQVKSVLLSASLVLGSLAAPLSHYLWMAASGHFGHIQHTEMAAGHSDHESSVGAHKAHAVGCNYSDLFATHVAGAPVVASLQSPQPAAVFTAVMENDGPAIDRPSGNLTRGPPAV